MDDAGRCFESYEELADILKFLLWINNSDFSNNFATVNCHVRDFPNTKKFVVTTVATKFKFL